MAPSHPAGTARISLRKYCDVVRRALLCHARLHLRCAAILGLVLVAALPLAADTITGTVKDPSGAVVPGARIEISGGGLAQPIVLSTDDAGKFSANLAPGKYTVRVNKEKFDELQVEIDLKGAADLPFNLSIAALPTQVIVPAKNLALANSDAVYRQLRDIGLGQSYRCENQSLFVDVGTFQFKSGTVTILPPVNRFVTGVIFVGQGHFVLKPVDEMNTRELMRRTGAPVVEEDFSEVVFRFTGNQYPDFSGTMGEKVETPAAAVSAYQHWKDKSAPSPRNSRKFHASDSGRRDDRQRGRRRAGGNLQSEASPLHQRLYSRREAQRPALFRAHSRGRHPAARFAGRSGADQFERRHG